MNNIKEHNDNHELMSDKTNSNVSKAFSKAWGLIETPKYNKKVSVRMKAGGTYSFEYTDLTGIFDAIKPQFKENGLSVSQDVETILQEGKLFLSVKTKIIHSSGEFLESSPMIVVANSNMQDMGGQQTYMRRYSLSAMLGLSTELDDDANASLGNEATFDKKQAPKQTPKAPEVLTMTQKNDINKKSKEYIKIRGKGSIKELFDHLKISDLDKITPRYAVGTIKSLDLMLTKAKEQAKEEAKDINEGYDAEAVQEVDEK